MIINQYWECSQSMGQWMIYRKPMVRTIKKKKVNMIISCGQWSHICKPQHPSIVCIINNKSGL